MTLAVEGCRWTASRPCRLTRKEIILHTVWLGDLVSRRSGVGTAVTKRKIFVSAQNWTRSPSPYHNRLTRSCSGDALPGTLLEYIWSMKCENFTMEGGPDSFQMHFTRMAKYLFSFVS
jgi:hypothetical protein